MQGSGHHSTGAPDRVDIASSPFLARCNRVCQVAARWWDCFLRFALVLWVVRVPLATTALGILLLGVAPQAQDIFVEFAHPPLLWRALLMVWFLFVLTAVWAMPTHYAARTLLNTDSRFLRASHDERAAGQSPCLERSAKYVPRLLGLLTFVAVEFAILRSYMNLPTLDEREVITAVNWALIEVALVVAAGAAAYLVWVVKRPRRLMLPGWMRWVNAKLGIIWRFVAPGRLRDSADEESRDVGRFLLAVIFVVFVGIFWFGAVRIASIFPRALAVPFILGGWLPFLSYLAGVGRQIRGPLIVGLFAFTALLTLVLGDNHSVRVIDADNVAGASVNKDPVALQDALRQWMRENQCEPQNGDETRVGNCPRPIIIAAAGGASRAGFFMATVTGYFMDEASRNGLDPDAVRQRLFAISGVSGGSMGAVMVTAALNAKTDTNKHPCIEAPVDQWWGQTVGNWRDCFEALASGDFLTADFFGFAFNDALPFGLWRDRAAVLEDSWSHRYRQVAAAANKSATPPKCQGLDCPFLSLRPRPGHWIPLLVLNGASEATGRRIVTTSLAMTYTPQAKGPNSCPTAVGQGPCPLFVQADSFHELLRHPVSVAHGWRSLGSFERYLLRDTAGDDVLLSTAAHNSARFPLISPPGSIRNQSRDKDRHQIIVDRIVDGGYFENYGALGAKELALAIHAAEPRLKPLVIVISNDPADVLDSSDDAESSIPSPPRAVASSSEFVTDVTAPLTTFANARTAHGTLGVAELKAALHQAIPDCVDLVIQIRVWPDHDKTLSMSWWESSLVQRQLHRQTELCLANGQNCTSSAQPDATTKGADQNRNAPHLEAIWQAMKNPRCKLTG
jgi:hypothetical protein